MLFTKEESDAVNYHGLKPGKYYENETLGLSIYVHGCIKPVNSVPCLIVEDKGGFDSFGNCQEHSVNWTECVHEDWGKDQLAGWQREKA